MKILHPTAMKHRAEFVRTQHHLNAEPGVSIEDVMIPGFWRHHSTRLKPGDLIDIMGEGYDITLRVKATGNGFVETYLLRKWLDDAPVYKMTAEEAAQIESAIPDGYVIDHTPRTLWRARMKDGGTEISRNHKTKPDAILSAIDHAKKTMGIAA